MLGLVHFAHGHLMRAKRAFGLFTIDYLWAGPAFERAQNDHRPLRPFLDAFGASLLLNSFYLGEGRVQRRGHQLVRLSRLLCLDKKGRVAIPSEKAFQFHIRNPAENRRAGDFISVEMQDRQDCAVANGIEEFIRVPARGQWAGFGFAIADHASGDEIRSVEHRPVRVRQRVTQLAAFMNRAWRFRRDMAGDAAREGELFEQPLHAFLVLRNVRIDFAVGAFQISVGDQTWSTMAGTRDVNDV